MKRVCPTSTGSTDMDQANHSFQHEAFHHEALFYAGEDGFLQGTLPFINDALAAEEPILIAVSNARIELLKQAIRDDGERVRFTEWHALGHNPARIIPAWREFLEAEAADGRGVR